MHVIWSLKPSATFCKVLLPKIKIKLLCYVEQLPVKSKFKIQIITTFL
jgi:hypothetical protein